MKLFLLSCILACTACIVILFSLSKYGVSWDEPIFFSRGDRYIDWILHPKITTITKHWQAYSDDIHPPLRQFLSAATRELLFNRLKILDVTRAYRISTLLFVFSGIFVLTYYAGLRYGLMVGLFCGIGLLLTPQIFYLANIASLDFSIAVLWFLSIISVLRKKYPSISRALLSGSLVGLAMLIKFSGVFLLIPVIVYMTVSLSPLRKNLNRIMLPLLTVTASFGVFFLLWPWLWVNPIGNMLSFIRLQSGHMGPMVWFMNQLYVNGPLQYPFVMFMISTPLVILIPFFMGLLLIIGKGTREERFLVLNVFYPFVLLLTIAAAKYDGIRLILPSYPFVVLVAGIGLKRLVDFMPNRYKKITVFLITIFVLISAYNGLIRIHPYQSAYYNEVVGGIAGAKKRGFESDYWGSPYLNILPWMNKHKDKSFCVFPTTNPFYYYLAMGYLESGVVFNAAPEVCDYLVVLMRQGYIYQYPKIVNIVMHDTPIYSVSIDSVPLVAVYEYPKGDTTVFLQDKALAQ